MANRKNVSSLNADQLKRFRRLLDVYINKPTDNPVAEHMAAGMDTSLDIHDTGFIAFLARLDNWLLWGAWGLQQHMNQERHHLRHEQERKPAHATRNAS